MRRQGHAVCASATARTATWASPCRSATRGRRRRGDLARRPALPRRRGAAARRAAPGGAPGRGARLRGAGAPGRLMRALGRGFYAVAGLSGMAFGVLAVAVPMHVAALHRPASLAGQLLASVTVAVAVGALSAGPLGRLVGSGRNVLAASMVVSAARPGRTARRARDGPDAGGHGARRRSASGSSGSAARRCSAARRARRAASAGSRSTTRRTRSASRAARPSPGVSVAVLRRAGADEALAVRLSYAVGAAATLAALALWRPERRGGRRTRRAGSTRAPTPGASRCRSPTCCWSRRSR